jgi:hypothetical protein
VRAKENKKEIEDIYLFVNSIEQRVYLFLF